MLFAYEFRLSFFLTIPFKSFGSVRFLRFLKVSYAHQGCSNLIKNTIKQNGSSWGRDTSTITPSRTARNLGVMIDDQLNFSEHTAKTARSCRFALFNIRKIRPFLSEHVSQLLVQALDLSRLDYCNALLAGFPDSSIKPLQLIQNAAARLVFNKLNRIHITPLLISLHWLPIAARIKFKALMFTYKTTIGSAPLFLNSLLQTCVPSRSLRSASEVRNIVPSLPHKNLVLRSPINYQGKMLFYATFTWSGSKPWAFNVSFGKRTLLLTVWSISGAFEVQCQLHVFY